MGANNVLPVVPTFVPGSPAISDLNNLSYAASFLIDHGVRPTWKFFSRATQSIGATAWTVVAFDHVAYDSDGTYSAINHGANIVTQGYYEMEASIGVQAGANKDNFAVAFQWSPTSGNPHFSAGVTTFGWYGSAMSQTGSAAADDYYTTSAISPFPAYPGDLFQVLVWSAAAHTLSFNNNGSFDQGRFSTQFTGRWVHSGT
jgi:hypothetical protein